MTVIGMVTATGAFAQLGGPMQLGGVTPVEVAIVGFLAGGLFFTFVSAVGVIRLPDVYARAHTASQTDTLGAGLTLVAVVLALGFGTTAIKTVLLLVFIFITNPTAAHAVVRAAHEEGIEPWREDEPLRDDRPGSEDDPVGAAEPRSRDDPAGADRPGGEDA